MDYGINSSTFTNPRLHSWRRVATPETRSSSQRDDVMVDMGFNPNVVQLATRGASTIQTVIPTEASLRAKRRDLSLPHIELRDPSTSFASSLRSG